MKDLDECNHGVNYNVLAPEIGKRVEKYEVVGKSVVRNGLKKSCWGIETWEKRVLIQVYAVDALLCA